MKSIFLLLVTILFITSCSNSTANISEDLLIGNWKLSDVIISDKISDPELKYLMEIEAENNLQQGFSLSFNKDYTGTRSHGNTRTQIMWRLNISKDSIFINTAESDREIYITNIQIEDSTIRIDYFDSGRYIMNKSDSNFETNESTINSENNDNPTDKNTISNVINEDLQAVTHNLMRNCDKPDFKDYVATDHILVFYLSVEGSGEPYPNSPDESVIDLIENSQRFKDEISPYVNIISYGSGCDKQLQVFEKYNVQSVPFIMMINDEGVIVEKALGILTEEKLINMSKNTFSIK